MKGTLRTYATFLCLFTSLSLISCGGGGGGDEIPPVSNTNFEATESFSSEVPVVNHTDFNLEGEDGIITITGMPGADSVVITGLKRVQSESTQDAEEHLQELEVNVQDLADRVIVETIQPDNTGGRNYIVDYTITLPDYFTVGVNNINGIVTLDSINNNVTVNNIGGNVILNNIAGSAAVALLSGTIESEVTLSLHGTIDLNTLTGDINLNIPVNTSAQLSATVSIGDITVSNLVLQNEVSTSTSLSGTLGSGQGTISLEAEELGDISIVGF